MLIKTRKNKNYTSILMTEVSEAAFKKAKEVYDSLEGLKVIKPTQKAWESFIKLHSLTLDRAEEGGDYKILGTTYTLVRKLDRNKGDEWFPIVRYYDSEWDKYEEMGIVSTDNFAVGVHETSFKNMTGKLLYF